ncbi:MAG TPA: prepilin-type N-terminal cleavage/methylation domain-containing protein [Candidatus Sulfotelmatobacter sp.]|nr:prepilin-type N-terminal cleavage/methylation domain-containing protein [Candidatus Sulfotelmatobacter sp.]
MTRRSKHNTTSGQQGGMTMIELMIAMVVLAVGIVGSMALIIRAVGGDSWSKQLSNSTALAQAVTERIMAIPASTNTIVTITDCANTVLNVNTAPGGPALNANGDVDFTAAAVANYQMLYTNCDTNGHQAIYDVRWNIAAVPGSNGYVKMLTVSSQLRSAGRNAMVFAPVATVRTMVGQGT